MPERHHYVPLVILRNFACDEKIWLFDKHADKAIRTNIRNAFVESDFNTAIGDGFNLEAEQIFGRAEAMAAPILRGILKERAVRHLGIEERAAISTFVAIQHLRSKQSRRTFSLFREEMARRFPGIPQSDYEMPGFAPAEADKFANLDFIVKNLDQIAQHFMNKDLLFVELDCIGCFWISDHPVILHNDNPRGHNSNLGLAVQGIQIYFPIAPTCAIAFFCPSIRDELKAGQAKAAKIKETQIHNYFANTDRDIEAVLKLAELCQAKKKIDTHFRESENQKIHFNAQNLIFLNSCQVNSAYRFLASAEGNFELALKMLQKSPELRKPNHINFG